MGVQKLGQELGQDGLKSWVESERQEGYTGPMQGLVILALGVTALAVTFRSRRRRKPTPTESIPEELGGMEEDRVFIEPGDPHDTPPDMSEFDNRAPCETFSREGENGFTMVREEGGACQPPWDLEPEQRTSAPFAEPGTGTPGTHVPSTDAPGIMPAPLWPIDTKHEHKVRVSYRDVRGKWHGLWGYHIGSKRRGAKSKKDKGKIIRRHHAGVDLYADEGDKVLAAEDGEVIAMFPFHHGTWSMYVRNRDGKIINYGELAKDSWVEFGFPLRVIENETPTVMVEAGQTLGRIGVQKGGGTMLHFETYAPEVMLARIRAGKMKWDYGKTAPPGLLDPSKYLVAAQHTWFFTREPKTT